MSISSLNLTLASEQRPGRFTLTWGDIRYSIEFHPETDVTLGDLLRRLRPVLVGGYDPSAKLPAYELLHAVGTRLWQALLPNTAPTNEREVLGQELRAGTTPLLLVLPQSLSVLPWELLCDPQQSEEAGFLARRRPLVRLVPGGIALPPIVPPLRVLLLISSPPNLEERQRLDVQSERTAVENATREVRKQGFLHLLVEDIVTPRRVQQALLRFKLHILHYIGHGSYDEGTGGYLQWEDDRGDPMEMGDTRLADLLGSRGLYALLLHGCKSATSAAHTEFRSVARTLLDAGIPAVLAQQASFTYESSQRASEMFYTALANGAGIAEAAFEVRQALAQADRPDWAVPILQATTGGLAPVLDSVALPGAPDPTLEQSRIAADLPAPTGVFVGRQRELRALRAMLENPPGTGPVLALIIGPGGVGKSTLAAQAIARYSGQYKSAFTLSCGGYQGIELFLQGIAECLQRQGASRLLEETLPDAKLSTAEKIEATIVALNQAEPFLVVIDKLESVQQEDRTLVDPDLLLLLQKLLTNLRGGRVLITGRYRVEDLLPESRFAANQLQVNLDDLSHRETQQLLEAHPLLADLGESVHVELLQVFGGLPYLYDVLSSKAAAKNLRELIHDAQGRVTHEHQQRSADEWEQVRRQVIAFTALDVAISRLPVQTRTLLGKLSIFRRSFPLEALEHGLGATRIDWQPLVDWALLQQGPINGNYQLHDLTARYAERLLDSSEGMTTRIQVAEWYLQYAKSKSKDLTDYLEAHFFFRSAGEKVRAGKLANSLAWELSRQGLYHLALRLCTTTIRDVENSQSYLVAEAQLQIGTIAWFQGKYREAHHWCSKASMAFEQLGDQEGLAASLHMLGASAQNQGKYEEAGNYFNESLKRRPRDQEARANTLHHLGMIAQDQGDYKEARRFYTEALTILEQLGNQRKRATTLHQLGIVAYEQGDYKEAHRLHTEVLPIFKHLNDQRGCAGTLHQLGMIAQRQGDYTDACRWYNQSLTIFDQLGDLYGRATTFGQLGMIAYDQREYKKARYWHNEGLKICKQQGDLHGQAEALIHLGNIAREQGAYEEAHARYNEALALFEHLGDRDGHANAMYELAVIANAQGKYQEAQHWYSESLRIKEDLNDSRGKAVALGGLGAIALEQRAYEEARARYNEALALFEQVGDPRGKASVIHGLGMIALEQRAYEEAHARYKEALTLLEQVGDRHGRAVLIHGLGTIAQQQGAYEEARAQYNEALTLFEQVGNQRDRAVTLHELGEIARKLMAHGEARSRYNEALRIFRGLNHRSGQAVCLQGLGQLAHQQGNAPLALSFTAQALVIFEQLRSPLYDLALHQVAELRIEVGEAAYTDIWQQATKGRSQPDLPTVDIPSRQHLLQQLIDFIQVQSVEEAQRMVDAYPYLLSATTEAFLNERKEASTGHIGEEARLVLDQLQWLIAHCREEGIVKAFTALWANQDLSTHADSHSTIQATEPDHSHVTNRNTEEHKPQNQ
jgi:tetratricopeptide (TPR) repeat protein